MCNEVWRAVAEARDAFAQGYPLVISKHGDLQYASRCWSENATGEEIELESTVRSHGTGGSTTSKDTGLRSTATETSTGGSTWMRSFWRMGARTSAGRNYQLYSLHLASLPAAAVADTMQRLVAECRELVQCTPAANPSSTSYFRPLLMLQLAEIRCATVACSTCR